MADVSSLPISDQLIRATARIECANAAGKRSCGTGFFFHADISEQYAPLLVTNRHVVEGQTRAVIHLTIRDAADPNASRTVIPFDVHTLQPFVLYHPSPQVDLAAIVLGNVEQALRHGGKVAEYVALRSANIVTSQTLEDARALEDLVMIGYPNGIWDRINNRPVVRRASSATPIFEDYNGQSKFLIDCACFPGSSGSPVFLFNDGMYSTRKGSLLGGRRVALVGILHAGFLHLTRGRVAEANVASIQQLEAEVTIPNSIGICVKASELNGLIAEVKALAGRLAVA